MTEVLESLCKYVLAESLGEAPRGAILTIPIISKNYIKDSWLLRELDAHTWGPQGVEFEEWHSVWSARRDLYVFVGAGSFIAAVALCIAALFQRGRRLTRG